MRDRMMIDRRGFLVMTGAAGLMLGLPSGVGHAAEGAVGADLSPYLRIDPDGMVTVFCGRSEMGQGVFTGLGTLVAEELECDWRQIRVETGGADSAFTNIYGGEEFLTGGHSEPDQMSAFKSWWLTKAAKGISEQFTGGSSSTRDGFIRMRSAGAAARMMLVEAAAKGWGVPTAECVAAVGRVSHQPSGKSKSYGELAAAAAKLDPPPDVALKPRAEWRVIGTKPPRLDLPAKVDGSAVFGIDVRLPGMFFATVANCPILGGTLKSFDAALAMTLPGVKAVLSVPGGIAAVADSTWRARKALEAVKIEWDAGANPTLDTAGMEQRYLAALDGKLKRISSEGDFDTAFSGAAKTITADYHLPFLAHAAMEPINCTADVRADGVDVWVPTQDQTRVAKTAAEIAGLSASTIRVHTTLLGGGFGRRAEVDFVAQAVTLSKALMRPVQLVWSREEDMRHDFYRPAATSRLTAAFDKSGMPVGWRHQVASSSIMARQLPIVLWLGPDPTITEGSGDMPYAIPHRRVELALQESAVPVGPWRSVGHSLNAFFKECFLDEVASAGGIDPVELRRRLLKDQPRLLAVLDRAAKEGDWGKPLPPGHGRGIALHSSFGTHVAEVAEIAVENGKISVKRVVAAVDCGTAINPDIITAQVESAIVYGMTAALFGKITVEKGQVVQANFPDYEMVRMAQMPSVEVHIIESAAYPGGIGEPATPPIAPAIANALFAATGKRARSLPLVDLGFSA